MSTELINIGKISGIFGVRGWVKIYSFTEVREDILTYSPWILQKDKESKEYEVVEGRPQGKTIVACLKGLLDRDDAAALNGWDILIHPEQLPKPKKNEYYWSDLIGLRVENSEGIDFGTIKQILETGANDVIVTDGEKERLIPFVQGQAIMNIDLVAGKMLVDWDAEF